MKGFKEFIMRDNLVELAVAVIIGTVFSAVVKEFTAVLMGFIGKIGGQPDFSGVTLFEVNIGLFINATITFLIYITPRLFCAPVSPCAAAFSYHSRALAESRATL